VPLNRAGQFVNAGLGDGNTFRDSGRIPPGNDGAVSFWLHPMVRTVFLEYRHFMKNKKHSIKTKQAGFILGAVLVAALTGGAGAACGQSIVVTLPVPVVVAAPVVVEDDYVYYPNYGVYYNSHRHQYYFLRGDVWVTQPAPEGVTAEVLLASPSVNMAFHDSPERHHAEMMKQYPHDWKRDGAQQDRKEDRKEDRRDDAPGHDKK
jgi:hypothetical protein